MLRFVCTDLDGVNNYSEELFGDSTSQFSTTGAVISADTKNYEISYTLNNGKC